MESLDDKILIKIGKAKRVRSFLRRIFYLFVRLRLLQKHWRDFAHTTGWLSPELECPNDWIIRIQMT